MHHYNCVFCSQEIDYSNKERGGYQCSTCYPKVKYQTEQTKPASIGPACLETTKIEIYLPEHEDKTYYKIVYDYKFNQILIYEATTFTLDTNVYGSSHHGFNNLPSISTQYAFYFMEEENLIQELSFNDFILTPTNAQKKLKTILNFK